MRLQHSRSVTYWRTGYTKAWWSAMARKEIDGGTVETLIKKLTDLTGAMEKMNIAEYVEFIRNPRRMFYVNFMAGLARGFGAAVGATVLAALFLYILSRVVELNLPLIGRFIAEIVRIVKAHLKGV